MNTIVIEEDGQIEIVEVARQGPPGPAGVNAVVFAFTQATPALVWTIAHNLGVRPSVSTFTLGGVEMLGMVQHLSNDVTQISFAVATAGTARLT